MATLRRWAPAAAFLVLGFIGLWVGSWVIHVIPAGHWAFFPAWMTVWPLTALAFGAGYSLAVKEML